MQVQIVAGNIGTGKTAYVLQKRSNSPKLSYLDTEALSRSLNPDPAEYGVENIALRQGLIKDFLRRCLPSTDVIIETSSTAQKIRKGLATMVRNVMEEKGLNTCSLTLVDFGPGSADSLSKAISHPSVISGGDFLRNKVIDRFTNLQKNYDRPDRIVEGFDIIITNK